MGGSSRCGWSGTLNPISALMALTLTQAPALAESLISLHSPCIPPVQPALLLYTLVHVILHFSDISYLGGSLSLPFNPDSHTKVSLLSSPSFCILCFFSFLWKVSLLFLPFDISAIVSPLETGREHANTIVFFLSGY